MGRSRTAPLLVTGVTVIAGALLVVATPGLTARSGPGDPAAAPVSRVHLPRSTELRTPAPASSPVPTTTAARGPGYPLDLSGDPTPTQTGPAEWPPRRFEPPDSPVGNPRYALPQAEATAVWSQPKSTGPPPPSPEGGWSAAAAVPAAVAAKSAAAAPAVRAAQAVAPVATRGTQDPGSNGYLVVGSVLLLAGGGLIVLARGIEAARPRRRRRGAHRHIA